MKQKKVCCQICKKEFSKDEMFPLQLIRSSLFKTLKKEHPDISQDGYICHEDLKIHRSMHIEKLLEEHRGVLSNLDQEVMDSLNKHEIIAQNINKQFQSNMTFGEKTSDQIAQFGGSWTFILGFLGLIVFWMFVNSFVIYRYAFDPYPYILLNLVLSCLAAIQAPIIMMSQNRQAKRDRMQADDDYRTNLKAELEVRQLNSRMDLFVKKQWERLLEIQQIQIDLAEEMIDNYRNNNHSK